MANVISGGLDNPTPSALIPATLGHVLGMLRVKLRPSSQPSLIAKSREMSEASQSSPIAAEDIDQPHNPARREVKQDRPPIGTWLRPELDLREPEGDELTVAILSAIASVENRERALKARDASNRYALVRMIAANALACLHHRILPNVAFRATAAFYSNGPGCLNGAALARTLALLQRAGFVLVRPGEWGRTSSLFVPDRRLLKLAGEHGATASSILMRLPSERLVRLRESNSSGPEEKYEATGATEAWVKQLEAYNLFVSQHDLTVDATREQVEAWVSKLNEDQVFTGLPFCRPELFNQSLYRTFNNGSFEQGGRLYGAWWINAPSDIRPHIKINGCKTVEYDYSGHAVRMLYHEQGIDYRDDPYVIDPLWDFARANGLEENHFREPLKSIFQALLNGDREGRPERARIEGFTFKPFKRTEIRKMIQAKHSEIGNAFGTGIGLRLQRSDSDLALEIIGNLMDQQVLALPIHDSFVVTEECEDRLIEEMNKTYLRRFGFSPLIKKED